jgi:hypothetical protein
MRTIKQCVVCGEIKSPNEFAEDNICNECYAELQEDVTSQEGIEDDETDTTES